MQNPDNAEIQSDQIKHDIIHVHGFSRRHTLAIMVCLDITSRSIMQKRFSRDMIFTHYKFSVRTM